MSGQSGGEAATSRERLTRERILAAARELIDGGGLERLSMRRLAQELDVWPMGIYRYFQDKDELIAALAESTAEEISTPDARLSSQERLQALLGQAAILYRRHPGALQAPRIADAVLAVLADAGLPEPAAQRMARILLAYTAGSAALAFDQTEFDDGLSSLLVGFGDADGIPGARPSEAEPDALGP